MEITNCSTVIICWCFLLFSKTEAQFQNRKQPLQQLSLHKEEDCSDPGESYKKSVRKLATESTLVACGDMKCFCNHQGLWIFSTYKDFKRSFSSEIKTGWSIFDQNGRTCESRQLNSKYLQLRSIRHVGNSNISVRSLSLYRHQTFLGPELRVNNGTRLSLPTRWEIKSYGFTGGKSWSIFSEINFHGNFTCLRAPSRTTLIGYNTNITLQVGSIWWECPRKPHGNFTLPKPENFLILYTKSTSGNETGANATSSSDSLFFDGTELQLPAAIIFVEFSIGGKTSQNKWTIYSGLDFNGKSRCLATFSRNKNEGQALPRYRFRRSTRIESDEDLLDFGETWLIGSVRRGCFPPLGKFFENDYSYDDEYYDYNEKNIKNLVENSEFRQNTTSAVVNSTQILLSARAGNTVWLNRLTEKIVHTVFQIFLCLFLI